MFEELVKRLRNLSGTDNAKQLTRNMLYRLLDEVFIPTGYIKTYKEDDRTTPGVVLTLAGHRLLTD